MIFKGRRYRKCKNVVVVHNYDFKTGEKYPHCQDTNYVYFGRILKDQDAADPKIHPLTDYYRGSDDNRKLLRAEVIPNKGHSLTNLMYGDDGRMYLFLDGVCYETIAKVRYTIQV